jgi:choline-sulfatase
VKRATRAAPFGVATSIRTNEVSREARTWPKRLALSIAGASFAGTLGAFVDALWANASVDGAQAPGYWAVARIDAGLVAPLSLCVGAAVAMFVFALEPEHAPSPRELWRGLNLGDRERRLRFAGFLGSLCVGVAFGATAIAQFAKAALALPGSNLGSGLAMSALTLGLFALVLVMALAAGDLLAASSRVRFIEVLPSDALLAGMAVALVVIALGVKFGTTSGEGGWLGIWGVLRRPELDLRPPALVMVVALGAYLLPHVAESTPWLAFGLAVVPLAFTFEAAVSLGDHPEIASVIEQGAPLGKICLTQLRRATDRDQDGYSALFGGGDCDDHDARINPAAQDIPGNGVDEDCYGGDAPPAAPTHAVAATNVAKTKDLLQKGLNVILITVDTLRADLGYAGYPKPVSPNLDALAARSVVFDRAYSLASYTGKSLGPLLIGKYPSETHRGWGHFNRFSTEDLFVSERLQKAGIHTISVQAHWYMGGNFGMARGYDLVDRTAQPPPGTDQDNDATVTGGKLTDAVLHVLGNPENTSTRFFAWIHYLDPHSEYARHKGAPDFGSGMRAAYDGEVWYVDEQIGKVLDFVEGQPWGAKTALFITSDHGEAFGEHYMIRHGVELWEELVRVPLIVHVPGVAPHHVAPPRSAIDLVPTILDLFEIAPDEHAGPFDFVSGHSLAADIAMPRGYEPPEREILVDMPAGPHNDDRRAFIRGGKKLSIAGSVRFTLFDLEQDPGEKDASDDKTLIAEMKAQYRAYKSQLREVPVKAVPKEPTSP